MRLFVHLPSRMKQDNVKNIFFNLIDEKALEFIAWKVAKLNGDIRVAFDMMKTALSTLHLRLSKKEELPPDEQIRVDLNIVLDIYRDKHGSKVAATLKN